MAFGVGYQGVQPICQVDAFLDDLTMVTKEEDQRGVLSKVIRRYVYRCVCVVCSRCVCSVCSV